MSKPVIPGQVLFRSLLTGIRWTFLHKVVGAGAGFGISVLSARLLGTEGYGALQYVLGVLQIVLVFGAFGLNQVIVRETAVASNENAWGRSRGIMTFALPLMATLTALGALAGGVLTIWPLHPDLIWLFALGFAATFARQMTVPFTAYLNGLRKIGLSGLGETTRNLILLGLLVFAYFIVRPDATEPQAVMKLRLIAALAGFVLLVVLTVVVSRRLPGGYFTPAARYDIPTWLRQGLSMMLVAGAGVVFANSDILMIGAMLDTASVAPYHAASRAADLTVFALAITLTPLGPIISKLHAAGQQRELRDIVRRSTRINFAIGLVAAAGLVVLAVPFLRLFGPDFVAGSAALRILVVAQLVNVAVGPVQLLLVMTGHHKYAAIGVVVAAISNLAMNAIFIPLFGIEGAAIGTAVSIITWNLLLLMFVRRHVWATNDERAK